MFFFVRFLLRAGVKRECKYADSRLEFLRVNPTLQKDFAFFFVFLLPLKQKSNLSLGLPLHRRLQREKFFHKKNLSFSPEKKKRKILRTSHTRDEQAENTARRAPPPPPPRRV